VSPHHYHCCHYSHYANESITDYLIPYSESLIPRTIRRTVVFWIPSLSAMPVAASPNVIGCIATRTAERLRKSASWACTSLGQQGESEVATRKSTFLRPPASSVLLLQGRGTRLCAKLQDVPGGHPSWMNGRMNGYEWMNASIIKSSCPLGGTSQGGSFTAGHLQMSRECELNLSARSFRRERADDPARE